MTNYSERNSRNAKSRWRNHDVKAIIRNCVECNIPLVSKGGWSIMTAEERKGKSGHQGKGLCIRCTKMKRRGGPSPTRAPQRKREEVLEEWELLRSDGVTDLGIAASRIGMTTAGLEKALERARAAGDPRAVVRRNDQLGGLSVQNTSGWQHRRAS